MCIVSASMPVNQICFVLLQLHCKKKKREKLSESSQRPYNNKIKYFKNMTYGLKLVNQFDQTIL